MMTVWKESILFVLYFLAYVAYLAWRPESELFHWITLVIIPVAILFLVHVKSGLEPAWTSVLRSVGLGKRPSLLGFAVALIVGALLSCLQLAGRNGEALRELIRSGRALWLWPLSFVLMVATAAGTEEFFFRGILQTRLTAALRSRLLAIGATAILFAIYHIPYAYHNPSWGTQNDLVGAIRAAAETGLPIGVLLGGVFAIAGDSLPASVLCHALINSFPGMLIVQKLIHR
jgi:membrane protease YdiL (CAAX protease family)